jgi:hypothetical protein
MEGFAYSILAVDGDGNGYYCEELGSTQSRNVPGSQANSLVVRSGSHDPYRQATSTEWLRAIEEGAVRIVRG